MSYLNKKELDILKKYFNAANYLSVGQLYLKDNPLLKQHITKKDVKNIILGHFGTVPGQNFIYTHLNRIIKKYDLNMIYISGPGHGGNALLANSFLDGSLSSVYEDITQDEKGMKNLFKSFSFPRGFSSHASAQIPGSIHEGGELGYSLAHSYGAVLDNKDLICACVIGDGEAETGPLLTSLNGNKFLNKDKDGVVLPIIHLNGFKISNPTVLSRMSNEDLINLFSGFNYDVYIVEDKDLDMLHDKMACTLDIIIQKINKIKNSNDNNFRYPLLIFKSLKGLTGPKIVEGKIVEGSFRSHQVPINITSNNESKFMELEMWLKSYKPDELFNIDGSIKKEIKEFLPELNKTMGLNTVTNNKIKELKLPNFKDYLTDDLKDKQDTTELSIYLKDVLRFNNDRFKIFSPDEMLSNRLNHVFEVTNRRWNMSINKDDEYLSNDGLVFDSYLSEHLMEGLLEGYVLTGRNGIFTSYEAFIRIVDSMVSQHAKWIQNKNTVPFRKDISSLNLLLTSHLWQQDHNGFTHQDPGFVNHLLNMNNNLVDVYFPVDSNSLIAVTDKCLKSKNKINAIIASKHLSKQYFNKEETLELIKNGYIVLKEFNDENPDIILCSIGDTVTREVYECAKILKDNNIKVKVIVIIDLLKLKLDCNKGLSNEEFDKLFTKEKPIIINYHGYESAIRELIYNRNNKNIFINGYKNIGMITTSFDMKVLNKIDRFNLIIKVINILDKQEEQIKLYEYCYEKLLQHEQYILENGQDMDEVL